MLSGVPSGDDSKVGSPDLQKGSASGLLKSSGASGAWSSSVSGGGGSLGQQPPGSWSGWKRGSPSSMAQSQAKQDWLVQVRGCAAVRCFCGQHELLVGKLLSS